jgi:hypothetical protein
MPGVKLLNEGSITTLSGRNATVQWGEMQMAVSTTSAAIIDTNAVGTNTVFVGATVDLMPVVNETDQTVQITLSASNTELIGIDDPGSFYRGASARISATPSPRYRSRTIETSTALVYSGQTFVVGNSAARGQKSF